MQAVGLLRRLTLMKNKPVHYLLLQRQYAKKASEFPTVTMNDFPSPEGDFYTQNNARQRIYNVHLVMGVGFLAFTIAFGVANDMYAFYNDIPDQPAEIDCYKED